MRKILCILGLVVCCLDAYTQGIQGTWHGNLKVMGSKLGIVLHIDGKRATLDSPDQGAKGIEAQVLYNDNDSLCVEVQSLGAKYSGRLVDGKIKGIFSQRGANLKLTLKEGDFQRNRPQTPQVPYPYQCTELTFRSMHDKTELCGTLTMPEGGRAEYLVVMVSGSGQQDRDETIFEHKPFWVLADFLARNNIASFRYDDRGVGKSQGLDNDLTTQTNMLDALSAVRMLREKTEVKNIGVLGHSEGGLIAFMLAGKYPKDVDFIISLAGTSVDGRQIIRPQLQNQYKKAMMTVSQQEIEEKISELEQGSKWMEFFLSYDPRGDIEKITCPVFAVNGDKDVQVLAQMNISTLQQYLKVKPKDFIKIYENLNHLFQPCKSGQPEEYINIEQTFSPEVMQDMLKWINQL